MEYKFGAIPIHPSYLRNLIVFQNRVLGIAGGGKRDEELLNVTLNFAF